MASYTTPPAVRDAVAASTGGSNDPGSAASLSDAQIQEAIDNAGAQVDGALAIKYGLPLAAPVPQLVVSLTTDIAAYLATLTWRRNRNTPALAPIQLRYDRAVALLAQLVAGTIELPIGESAPSAGSAWNTSPDTFWLGGELFPRPWYGPHEAGGAGSSDYAANVAALAADRTTLAMDPDLLLVGVIVRSTGGCALSGSVRWPDGTMGTYVGVEDPSHPGFVQTYTLTYGELPTINSYAQPAMTRDVNAEIVNRPNIVAT